MSILYFPRHIKSIVSSFFLSKYQNEDNKYYYVAAFCSNSNNHVYIFRDYFESTTFKTLNINTEYTTTNLNIITCFETEQYKRICLYQNSESNLEIQVYFQENNLCKSTILYTNMDSNALIFFKGIHLKNEIGVFMYYESISSTEPIVSIRIYDDSSYKMIGYNSYETINLDKFLFNSNILLNDIRK